MSLLHYIHLKTDETQSTEKISPDVNLRVLYKALSIDTPHQVFQWINNLFSPKWREIYVEGLSFTW